MKWIKNTTLAAHDIYELRNNDEKLLSLDLHPFTNSARIQYASEKRVFLIRKEGFLRNKTVLCTEYGIRLGHVVFDNKEKFIELNNERFYYDIRKTPAAEMLIYTESKAQTLIACEMDWSIDDPKKESALHSCLLLALVWYLFLPAVKPAELLYA
jgi:hypothetical protein